MVFSKRFTTTTTTAAAAASMGAELKQSTAAMNKVFECKTCSREFSSFQALGGHTASHKKVRLIKGDESKMDGKLSSSKASSLHECSICGKGYAIGQALGGHMRRHRNPDKKTPSVSPPSSPPSEELFSLPLLPHMHVSEEPKPLKRKLYEGLCLDLSLGPPCSGIYQEEGDSDDHHQSMPTKPYVGLSLFT